MLLSSTLTTFIIKFTGDGIWSKILEVFYQKYSSTIKEIVASPTAYFLSFEDPYVKVTWNYHE